MIQIFQSHTMFLLLSIPSWIQDRGEAVGQAVWAVCYLKPESTAFPCVSFIRDRRGNLQVMRLDRLTEIVPGDCSSFPAFREVQRWEMRPIIMQLCVTTVFVMQVCCVFFHVELLRKKNITQCQCTLTSALGLEIYQLIYNKSNCLIVQSFTYCIHKLF